MTDFADSIKIGTCKHRDTCELRCHKEDVES